jgi:endoglucanase
MRRICAVLAVAAVALLGQEGVGAATPRPAGRAVAQLRIDQAGYLRHETKIAILMTSRPAAGARYFVRRDGRTVISGHVPHADRGAWNATYRHTYAVRFSRLHTRGSYRLVVQSTPRVARTIRIRTMRSLYRRVLVAGVHFDQVQRDGPDVIAGSLDRKPSHLHDAHAIVYRTPHFNADDAITDPKLYRIGGPTDVAGGWFDAGDFPKFTHTAAFATIILLNAQRELGAAAPRSLVREGRYGLAWLRKMWHGRTKTMLLQVGIGEGTTNGKWIGDHDIWRLPQVDDSDSAPADTYAASHRPVFRAGPPGSPISPNLAGRVAAAFALAAQVEPHRRAVRDYHRAVAILRLADTASPPHPLTTVLPNDFYPESTWRDDMELGTAEAALAAQRLHRPARHWMVSSARFARRYLNNGSTDTFNLYDTSALADVALVHAMKGRRVTGLPIRRHGLVAALASQLRGAAKHAKSDPFHTSGDIDEFDVDSHTFGVVASAGWYHQLTGRTTFDKLAAEDRDWLFGTNAWGESFMVGIGTKYPDCMQHQVANLSGSTDGSPPIALGAVVNGPNSKDLFQGGLGGDMEGMRPCAVHGLKRFDGHGSRFIDDVRSWQTDEPALDMTGTAIAAAAAQLNR